MLLHQEGEQVPAGKGNPGGQHAVVEIVLYFIVFFIDYAVQVFVNMDDRMLMLAGQDVVTAEVIVSGYEVNDCHQQIAAATRILRQIEKDIPDLRVFGSSFQALPGKAVRVIRDISRTGIICLPARVIRTESIQPDNGRVAAFPVKIFPPRGSTLRAGLRDHFILCRA